MARGKTSEGKGKESSWYGRKISGNYLVYKGIETGYVNIFDALRSGQAVELELEKAVKPPELRELLIEYGRHRIKQEFAEDQYIRKFFALIPELDKSLNLILEKVSGFGLFTGVNYNSNDPCGYFRRLRGLDLPEDISHMMDRISESAESICSLKSQALDFLREKIRIFMPNTSNLVGEEVAIELLYQAGSIRNLALMPASAIQVLGAEKALFKHILHGAPPPKHGAIFKVKGISSLRTKDRGKVARYIAGKIAIAARADFRGTSLDFEKEKEHLQLMLKRKK